MFVKQVVILLVFGLFNGRSFEIKHVDDNKDGKFGMNEKQKMSKQPSHKSVRAIKRRNFRPNGALNKRKVVICPSPDELSDDGLKGVDAMLGMIGVIGGIPGGMFSLVIKVLLAGREVHEKSKGPADSNCEAVTTQAMNMAISKAVWTSTSDRDKEYIKNFSQDYQWLMQLIHANSPYDDNTPLEKLHSVVTEIRNLIRALDKHSRMYYAGSLINVLIDQLFYYSMSILLRYQLETNAVTAYGHCLNVLDTLKIDIAHYTDVILDNFKQDMHAKFDSSGSVSLSVRDNNDDCTCYRCDNLKHFWYLKQRKDCENVHYGRADPNREVCQWKNYVQYLQINVDKKYLPDVPVNSQPDCSLLSHWIKKTGGVKGVIERGIATYREKVKKDFWREYVDHYDKYKSIIANLNKEDVQNTMCIPYEHKFFPQTITPSKGNLITTIDNPSNVYILSFNMQVLRLGSPNSNLSIMRLTANDLYCCDDYGTRVPDLMFSPANTYDLLMVQDKVSKVNDHIRSIKGVLPNRPNSIKILATDDSVNLFVNGALVTKFTSTLKERPVLPKLDIYVGSQFTDSAHVEITGLQFSHLHKNM